MKPLHVSIVESQLEFYRNNGAGCSFAALAAKFPSKYGWVQKVLRPDADCIDDAVSAAITDPSITTLSLIFPDVSGPEDLVHFVETLKNCRSTVLEQDEEFEGMRCLGFRTRVNGLLSWVTGFGRFDFLPITRRSPF